MSSVMRTLPRLGESFDLTLENDIDLVSMLTPYPKVDPENFEYTGGGILKPRTRRFKLIWLGKCSNQHELISKHANEKIPEGKWIQPFRVKFPFPDGRGPIGIADTSWRHRRSGQKGFPALLDARFVVWQKSVEKHGNRHFNQVEDFYNNPEFEKENPFIDDEMWSMHICWSDDGTYIPNLWRWIVEDTDSTS